MSNYDCAIGPLEWSDDHADDEDSVLFWVLCFASAGRPGEEAGNNS